MDLPTFTPRSFAAPPKPSCVDSCQPCVAVDTIAPTQPWAFDGIGGAAGTFATTAGFAAWVDVVAAGALAVEPELITLAGAELGDAFGAAETMAPANNAPAAPNAIKSRFIDVLLLAITEMICSHQPGRIAGARFDSVHGRK